MPSTQYMPPKKSPAMQRERDVLGEDPYAYIMGENEKRTLAA